MSVAKQNKLSDAKIAFLLVSIVIGMVGMSFAAVPLYNLFCKVTGYGGTTQIAENDLGVEVLDRAVKIRFSAATHRDMPWDFKPMQVSQTLKVGEQGLAFFEAHNPTSRTIVGTATFNVTPYKAGPYFMKIECFCFTEQVLKPGETVTMPVSYFVDPAMAEDINLNEVGEITLSYTFFVKKNPESLASAGAALQ